MSKFLLRKVDATRLCNFSKKNNKTKNLTLFTKALLLTITEKCANFNKN